MVVDPKASGCSEELPGDMATDAIAGADGGEGDVEEDTASLASSVGGDAPR